MIVASLQQLIVGAVGGIALSAVVFAFSLYPVGQREISSLETIHGVPYPSREGVVRVFESLAHADVYLREPVIAKSLKLSVKFHPHQVQRLSVGIRENEFWLSYPLTVLTADSSVDEAGIHTAVLTIPLTDKLQDADRSVDLMFVATGAEQVALEDGDAFWELHELAVETMYGAPSLAQLKDYARGVLKRERPL